MVSAMLRASTIESTAQERKSKMVVVMDMVMRGTGKAWTNMLCNHRLSMLLTVLWLAISTHASSKYDS